MKDAIVLGPSYLRCLNVVVDSISPVNMIHTIFMYHLLEAPGNLVEIWSRHSICRLFKDIVNITHIKFHVQFYYAAGSPGITLIFTVIFLKSLFNYYDLLKEMIHMKGIKERPMLRFIIQCYTDICNSCIKK